MKLIFIFLFLTVVAYSKNNNDCVCKFLEKINQDFYFNKKTMEIYKVKFLTYYGADKNAIYLVKNLKTIFGKKNKYFKVYILSEKKQPKIGFTYIILLYKNTKISKVAILYSCKNNNFLIKEDNNIDNMIFFPWKIGG